jgi:VWFA-related protein
VILALALGGAFVTAQEQQFEIELEDGETAEQTGPPVGGLAFVDEVDVTVVNVIAYVTTKKGDNVSGLTKEDFRLYQDGEERPITNFQGYSKELIRSYYDDATLQALEAPPDQQADEADKLPDIQPVWMMVFIDNDNLRPLDRNRVISQTRAFIRENLRPPVQMMVVDTARRLRVVQEFTSDSDQIASALKSLKMHTGGRTSRDSSRNEFYDELDRAKEGQRSSQRESFGRARGLAYGFAEEEQNELQFTLGALREAVTMMSGLPGKKMILYVSNGLPMTPGIDLFYAMSNTYNDPSLLTEANRYNQSRAFSSLTKNANAQGVTFYTIAAGGLENVTMSSAQYHGQRDTLAATVGHSNYLDSLRFMADETGGVAIFNTNDVSTRIGRIEQDFYDYYSIGYPLQASGADKVHRIKLEIPGHPEYQIRYRRRMVEKSLESRVQDSVVTGLMVPLGENPLQVTVNTDRAAPASSQRWTVPVRLTFPIRNVALIPYEDEYVGRVAMFLAARDNDGKQSDLIRQEHEVRIAADDLETAQKRDFTIKANLLMEPGTYKVSVGLLDHITRQVGYATSSVVVGE